MPTHPDDADGSFPDEPTQPMTRVIHTGLGSPHATLAPAIRIRGAEFDMCTTRQSAQTPIPDSLRSLRFPVLPGYEILGELGRGGMGVVYRARQVRLNRFVALKMLLHADCADLSDVVRFRSEAEAVAAVKHPHVVQVHEFGHFEGKPYFAMEFLSGGTLYNRIKTHSPLAPRYAAALAVKLAQAVQVAHAQGIVHRDLKPGNILFDEAGEPRITDFGLAKRVSLQITQTQAIMGTPAYMSPEQASGRTKFVGPPSDIYALGIILYECLTGRTPFTGIDSIAVLHQVMNDSPKSPRSVVKEIPRDLELICLKCLEKLPGDRYITAEALAEDLGRYLAGKPVHVRPAGPIERTVKWARRRPTMATVYALSTLVLVISLVGLAVGGLWRDAVHARNDAAGHWSKAEAARVEADEHRLVAEEARDLLAKQNGELEVARQKIAAALAGEKVATADARRAEQDALDAKSKVEEAKERLEGIRYFRNVAFANLELRQGNVLAARKHLDDCPEKRRDWEWWHAYRIAHEDAGSGSTNSIATDVAFTGDGINVTTAHDAGVVTQFDFAKGVGVPKSIVADRAGVYQTRLAEDASRVLTARYSAKKDADIATVWDTKTGRSIGVFPATAHGLRSSAISADGRRVLIGYNSPPQLTAYDAATGKTLGTLDGYCPCEFTALNRDGTRALVARQIKRQAGFAYEIVLWDTATGEVLVKRDSAFGQPSALALDGDGTCAAIGYHTGELALWDLRTEKTIPVAKAHTGALLTLGFRRDGKKLATSGDDGIVRVWNVQNGSVEQHMRGHSKRVFRLRFDSTGRYIASTDAAQRFFIWDLKGTDQAVVKLTPNPLLNGNFVAERSCRRVFSFGEKGDGQFWDLKSGTFYPQPAPVGSKFTAFAFDPKGNRFAAGTDRGAILLWDDRGTVAISLAAFQKTKLYREIGARSATVIETLAFSGDGSRLLAGDGWQLAVFDTTTHETVFANQFRHAVVCFGEDGRHLAANWNKEATVWTIGSEEIRKCSTGGKDWVSSLAIGPNGEELAAGTRDWEVFLFDLATPNDGKLVRSPRLQLAGHSAAVQALGYHPKGHRLISGAEDGSIKVWDTASGNEAISPTISIREPIRSVGFSAGGNEVIAIARNHAPYILHGATRPAVIPPRR